MQKNNKKVSTAKKGNTAVIVENGLLSVATFILAAWGFILFWESFIPVYIAILTSVAGSTLVFGVYKRIRKPNRSFHHNALMMTYIALGASIGFLSLNAINYYGPREPVQIVQLPILSKSKTSSRYSSHCTSPLVTVRYDHVKKTFRFKCDELKVFNITAQVRLRIEKGMLGYYVVTDKRLIYNTALLK